LSFKTCLIILNQYEIHLKNNAEKPSFQFYFSLNIQANVNCQNDSVHKAGWKFVTKYNQRKINLQISSIKPMLDFATSEL